MLGAYQVQVVAYINDSGEVLCASCAGKHRERRDDVNVDTSDWTQIIRYEADEYASEDAYENDADDSTGYGYICDECGHAVADD